MPGITYAQVWSDHAIGVGEPGDTTVVTVLSGGTVYYGDPDVTSTHNLGSLTVGQSTTVSKPMDWLRSASQSYVQITSSPTSSGGFTPTGDLGGTSGSTIVETVGGGLTPVNTATFLGNSQVVRPSGDATGATDAAAINAALVAQSSVYLNGNYTVNATLAVPSNTTLILADAKITLANAANCPIITNPSYASVSVPAATNIHVRGIGRAILDYNGANQTASTTTPWQETSIFFCNVTNFSISDIQTQNNIYVALWFEAASNGRIENIHHEVGATDLGFIHADVGSQNIHFTNLTANGDFHDSVFSMNSVANTAFPAVRETPYAHTLTGSARYISGLSWSNITLSSGTGMFCCFLDANGQCNDIDISNVHNTYSGTLTNYEFDFGPCGYHLTTLPVQGAASGWKVNGYTMGGQNHVLLGIDTPMIDMQFSGIKVAGNGQCAGLIGNQTDPTTITSYYPQITGIRISDVDIPTLSGPMVSSLAGSVISGISIENVRIGTCSAALLQNASDVAGLHMTNVKINALTTSLFNSTANESGVVGDINYQTKGAALTAVVSKIPQFRIEQPFPVLASADSTPRPVRGSELLTYNTKDPTGGAATTGGRWTADGLGWSLAASGNSVFSAGQLYRRQLVHYDAGSLSNLTNGASVARWPDTGPASAAVVQATSANQPTFVASDSVLNNRPSVAFNGSTSFLQNGLLTPVIQSGAGTSIWVDVFIVHYWTTLASTIAMEMASNAAGSPGIGMRLLRTAANLEGNNASGGAGATTAALTINTAYITYFAVSASNHLYIAQNKLAQTSETNVFPGASTNLCTGVTLGSSYTGTSQAAVNIAEVVAYYGTGQISATDWATVMAGLALKYNVTLS